MLFLVFWLKFPWNCFFDHNNSSWSNNWTQILYYNLFLQYLNYEFTKHWWNGSQVLLIYISAADSISYMPSPSRKPCQHDDFLDWFLITIKALLLECFNRIKCEWFCFKIVHSFNSNFNVYYDPRAPTAVFHCLHIIPLERVETVSMEYDSAWCINTW